jgi:hypothetical protein
MNRTPHETQTHRHTRRRALALGVGFFALLGLGRSGRADGPDFIIVVHPDNPAGSATRDFLEEAFLKRRAEWAGGEPIKPVDLQPDHPVRDKFSKRVLRRSVAAVKSYWQQRIFSGRGVPPPEVPSDQAVLAYVLAHRGGIGYVSGSADLGKAKAVAIR